MDSVIRLNLEKLGNPHKAFAVVRKTRSTEGASMVANYCLTNHDFKAAIEFLLLAKRNEEAFDFAQTHAAMDAYVQVCGFSVVPNTPLNRPPFPNLPQPASSSPSLPH